MSADEFEERVVTVPLRAANAEANHKRADKAMTIVREHLAKQFAVEEEDVRLDPSVNEAVWSQGRGNPPGKVRVRAARFQEAEGAVVEAEHAR
ncbi:50S ribosomal protein L31e [Halobacteriales archaeon SW_5_70_135]|nr:MAG: 50S ribosomal protein L31e [Halobacteriales archaeon SW_5_70_135]